MNRSLRAGVFKFVGDDDSRQVTVIATDATPDRMGDIVEPGGALLDNFRANPIILAQHDNAKPIARAPTIGMKGGQIEATLQFPPAGVSALSDEYLGLIKAGVLSAVSIGFMPLAWEPLKSGGLRFTSWELYELSVVSVPANPSAIVTQRAFAPGEASRMAHARNLHRGLTQPRRSTLAVDADEAAMEVHARRLALRHLRDGVDLTTAAGRAQHARRLRTFHANGGRPVDPRAVLAEAAFRTAARW